METSYVSYDGIADDDGGRMMEVTIEMQVLVLQRSSDDYCNHGIEMMMMWKTMTLLRKEEIRDDRFGSFYLE